MRFSSSRFRFAEQRCIHFFFALYPGSQVHSRSNQPYTPAPTQAVTLMEWSEMHNTLLPHSSKLCSNQHSAQFTTSTQLTITSRRHSTQLLAKYLSSLRSDTQLPVCLPNLAYTNGIYQKATLQSLHPAHFSPCPYITGHLLFLPNQNNVRAESK